MSNRNELYPCELNVGERLGMRMGLAVGHTHFLRPRGARKAIQWIMLSEHAILRSTKQGQGKGGTTRGEVETN